MAVYEYLTLTDREASAIVDALNGYWWQAEKEARGIDGAAARLAAQFREVDEDAGLAAKWGIDGDLLFSRLAHLTDAQAAQVQDAALAFWESVTADGGLYMHERLSNVGLV